VYHSEVPDFDSVGESTGNVFPVLTKTDTSDTSTAMRAIKGNTRDLFKHCPTP
jgi:hypothetical protein